MASDFKVPVDIANRALQRVGALRITAPDTLLNPITRNSSEVAFCYDKLRRAELRRNIWTFAIRKAVLRPIDPTTAKLVPVAWSNTATYPMGAIVSYIDGEIYQARFSVGVNVEPDINPTSWQQYFGPMTVTVWSQNGVANGPQPWSAVVNYALGSQAIGSDNYVYSSLINGNLNNNPVGDGGVHWYQVALAANGPGYYAGELVYTPVGPNPGVYLSLTTSNSDNPTTIPAYVSTQTYNTGQTVVSNATTFQSNIDFNVGQTPQALWLVGTTYPANAIVLASDNNLYSSVAGGNIGHNPVGDAGVHWTLIGVAPWILVPGTQSGQMQGINWLKLASTIAALQITYPVGSGPSNQSATRNV
jgi:hypothetical protein